MVRRWYWSSNNQEGPGGGDCTGRSFRELRATARRCAAQGGGEVDLATDLARQEAMREEKEKIEMELDEAYKKIAMELNKKAVIEEPPAPPPTTLHQPRQKKNRK